MGISGARDVAVCDGVARGAWYGRMLDRFASMFCRVGSVCDDRIQEPYDLGMGDLDRFGRRSGRSRSVA
jgi:hypothetical protein